MLGAPEKVAYNFKTLGNNVCNYFKTISKCGFFKY